MAEKQIDQGFTDEQLLELQIDSALGGDIPGFGLAGVVGRKVIPKALDAGKKVFTEVYEHYVEGKAAKEAAKAATIQELRASLKPFEEVFKKGVEEGKLDPNALTGKVKGADLFVKNSDDLRKYLSPDDFRNYAKLAIEDEKIYRETLSGPGRFLRAFHYDNANPELGYVMGPVRYGGTYNSHLYAAAADTELQEMGIVMLSNLRGAAQTVATGVIGVKVALDATTEEQNDPNVDTAPQKVSGEQALQVALKLVPQMQGEAEEALNQIQKDYAGLSSDDRAKFPSPADYLDAAKRSVAKEILTMKLEPLAGVGAETEKRSSLDSLSVNEKIAFIDKQISLMPEHQQEAMRQTVANNVNANGIGIVETEINQQQIERA